MSRRQRELQIVREILDRALRKMYGDDINITDDASRLRIIRDFDSGGLTVGLEGLPEDERAVVAVFVTFNAGFFADRDDFKAAVRLAGREAVLILAQELTQTQADADRLLGLLTKGPGNVATESESIYALGAADTLIQSAGVRAAMDRWIEWRKEESFLDALDTLLPNIPGLLGAGLLRSFAGPVIAMSGNRLLEAMDAGHLAAALVIAYGLTPAVEEGLDVAILDAAHRLADTFES